MTKTALIKKTYYGKGTLTLIITLLSVFLFFTKTKKKCMFSIISLTRINEYTQSQRGGSKGNYRYRLCDLYAIIGANMLEYLQKCGRDMCRIIIFSVLL